MVNLAKEGQQETNFHIFTTIYVELMLRILNFLVMLIKGELNFLQIKNYDS